MSSTDSVPLRFAMVSFACIGSGKPIGYPVIELETAEHEWEVFEHVDREKCQEWIEHEEYEGGYAKAAPKVLN